MPIITLSIPGEMKKEMEDSKEINWSHVARVAIKTKLAQLRILKAITEKSDLTEEQAIDIGKKINKSLHKRLNK